MKTTYRGCARGESCPEIESVPEHAGSQDAEAKQTVTGNSATKPDIDLQSWAALGASAKPSRKYRKPNWKPSKTRTAMKSLIVTLALWGWIPFSLATWLIQSGGLRHD